MTAPEIVLEGLTKPFGTVVAVEHRDESAGIGSAVAEPGRKAKAPLASVAGRLCSADGACRVVGENRASA